MSEMPNLEVWNGNYAHLDKKTNRVELTIRTYVKNIDDNYGNSTAIGNVNVVFSVESFTDFVSDMTTRLEKVKADLAEIAEVE
jgi:predicted N-formylglutamate amidohydrolase